MSEGSEGLPKAGAPDQTERITPREIKGLLEATSSERAINFKFRMAGLYLGETDCEFTYDVPRGITPSAIFEVKIPDFREEGRLREEGKALPPELILKVVPNEKLVPEMQELMRRRALEHNAARIEEFLAKGGDLSLLPQTDLLPPGLL